jgi:2-oxo-4-hydroxy-4-carboxy--5-ureidoimidazoline (OHCU) decarboxylase
LTHITEDAAFAAWVASMHATEKLTSAAAQAAEAAKRVHQQALKSAEPHIQLVRQKSQRLYGDYAEPHVETLRPHYNQYAAPLLEKAAGLVADYHARYGIPVIAAMETQARQAVKDANTKRREWFDSRIAKFGRECPQSMSIAQQWAKENNVTLPKLLVKHWTETCQHPRESVSICLKALGLLAVYILRRKIYRMIVWCAFLPFVVLWFLNPLRWLCATNKKNKKEYTATTTTSQPPKRNPGNQSNGKGDHNTR